MRLCATSSGIVIASLAPSSHIDSRPWAYRTRRLIGSIRRECVDHIIVSGEAHLRRILRSYARYFNEIRTHRSLNKDAPVSLARSSGLESLNHMRSSEEFIIITFGFSFSAHTASTRPLDESALAPK
jgi:hypothetical protein